MQIALRILRYALHLYTLLLLVHVILSWVYPRSNRWTVLLDRIVEPVLGPVRALLRRILPARAWVVDWSPLAVMLMIQLVNRLLRLIR
ncbi:MAG: YggT family protein [Clostridia bacterium]|nr:YggT family protein [Clostridia bacterium]